MPSPRDVLTPDALALLQAIAGAGSFAAAARASNLAPSAVTYRVRQLEDALQEQRVARRHIIEVISRMNLLRPPVLIELTVAYVALLELTLANG